MEVDVFFWGGHEDQNQLGFNLMEFCGIWVRNCRTFTTMYQPFFSWFETFPVFFVKVTTAHRYEPQLHLRPGLLEVRSPCFGADVGGGVAWHWHGMTLGRAGEIQGTFEC